MPDPSFIARLRVGDRVTRMIAGEIPMVMRVVQVLDDRIVCDSAGAPAGLVLSGAGLWQFDKKTGMEIDDDLGFGPAFGITGSFLVPYNEDERAERRSAGVAKKTAKPQTPKTRITTERETAYRGRDAKMRRATKG